MAETKKKKRTAGSAAKAGTKPRTKTPAITMQDALQIAQAYLADKGAFGISGVTDQLDENLAAFFSSRTGITLKDCWFVECGLDPFLVVDGGMMLIAVSKTTGDILYAGILSVA